MFRSVGELEDAIRDYLDQHNTNPKPFVWTKSAQTILEKERRAKKKLDQIQLGVSDVRLPNMLRENRLHNAKFVNWKRH